MVTKWHIPTRILRLRKKSLNNFNCKKPTLRGAFLLVALSFFQLPAGAQRSQPEITRTGATAMVPASADEVVSCTSVLAGLPRGQTMRFTLFNSSGSPRVALRAQVKLFDAVGRVIAESAEMVIQPGEFHSFDFNRDDISLGGEAGTGRLQVRGTITCFESRGINDAGRDQTPPSVELVDNTTGATTAAPYVPLLAICKGV